MLDPATLERRQEIEEAWEGLEASNHFEVLGLERNATEVDVKEAYFRRAKRFHPDAHHDASLNDLRDKLERVFIRLGEAYEVLRSREKRSDYEQRLGRPRPRPQPSPEGAKAPTATETPAPEPQAEGDAEADREPAVARAEQLYAAAQKAEEDYHATQMYWEAIQLLEPMVDEITGKLLLRAQIVLARCYVENPKWVKRGEETLLAASRSDPKATEPLLLLGALYEGRNLRTRAAAMYRKVLDLRPSDRRAHDALRRLETEPARKKDEGDDSGGGGFFKKMFKRR